MSVVNSEERIYYGDDGTAADSNKLPPALCEFLRSVDKEEKGFVTSSALQLCGARISAVEQPKKSRGVTSNVLREFDFDGDGFVESKDLEMAARHKSMMHSQLRLSKRLIFGLLASLVVLALAMFGVSFAAVELAKDTHVGEDKVVRTGEGEIALIGSADLMVVNGTLYQREVAESCSGGSCRRLTESAAHALVTGSAQERKALTSRIADEVFQNLEKVTVHLTESDEIVTEVTLRVHGFMRTRKVGSHCGTIVRLDMLEGTIILDDSDVHLDARMDEHFRDSGLALGETSPYGRWLQMTGTDVLGIFSHFDDLEVRCQEGDAAVRPQSPKMPYRVTMLEKRPCIKGKCDSKIFENQKIPGYDTASDSVWTYVTALVAEDYSVSFATWPNHPGQELITVTDKLAETTFVTRCWNETYSPIAPMNESDWHVVYLGEALRAESVIEYMDQTYTIPASTNRVFRVRSNNDTTDAVIDYEDDAVTMLPQRMFMYETEEVLTLELTEMEQSEADALRDSSLAPLSCDAESGLIQTDYPHMDDPLVEAAAAVKFYALDMKENPGSDLSDSYWAYAQDHTEEIEEYINETTNSSRRLWTKKKCGPDSSDNPDVYIPFGGDDCMAIDIDLTNGLCVSVSTSYEKVTTPWSLTGSITAGNCYGGGFSVNGQVTIGYGWSIDLGGFFKAGFSIYGFLGGTVGQFTYTHVGSSCPARRLLDQRNLLSNTSEASEDEDDLSLVVPQEDDMQLMTHNEDEEEMQLETVGSSSEDGRRLWWSRRRYVSRRRRTVTCKKWGAKFYAGIGVKGWASVIGIGASVQGELKIEFGPFPHPLAQTITLVLSGKACVKVWWWQVCASFSVSIR